MYRYIALLRGVNIGGKKLMRMEDLRHIFLGSGFRSARTYLQSGNVVFQSANGNIQELTQWIEAKIEQVFGYHASVFLLKRQAISKILLDNPFINDRNEDPSKLYVTFLYQAPLQDQWAGLTPPSGTTDEMAIGEGVIYLWCPSGYGKTRLSNHFFESKLGVLATTRNWNTVKALCDLAEMGENP
jgi:uncharacterized protein (DUF1697 family)